MAIEQVDIAEAGRATLVYLAKRPYLGQFLPLQSLRSGVMKPDSDAAKPYFAMERTHAARLAGQLATNWDAVVAPPSSRPWAIPYLAAGKKLRAAVDLTSRFSRVGNVRSGEAGTCLDDLVASLTYSPGGDEPGFSKILFVDDVLAAGKTFAAIIQLLRRHGLPHEAEFQIGVPLWLPTAASASSSPG